MCSKIRRRALIQNISRLQYNLFWAPSFGLLILGLMILPTWHPGPLLTLRGFHPGILKHCSMHILNLGICMHTNGASLFRGVLISTLFFSRGRTNRCKQKKYVYIYMYIYARKLCYILHVCAHVIVFCFLSGQCCYLLDTLATLPVPSQFA